jgi:penicillin-binding protein 1A
MTWQAVMSYAHQGIELKPIPGVPAAAPPSATPVPVAQASDKNKGAAAPALRPTVLTQRGAETLVRIERMMEDASRALAASGSTVSEHSDGASRSGTVAAATGGVSPNAVRGN